MNELHVFAGGGGGILGGLLLGHTCVCAVEIEHYRRAILLQRQRDGILPRFPIWDDIRTFDGRPWRGLVDIVCGGFPCQDVSAAGKGAGITGPKSSLWREMARVIRDVRPSYAFVENSPHLTKRGLGTVLGDLASMGYDACWDVFSAAEAGAPHLRKRLWILAYSESFKHSNTMLNRRATGLGQPATSERSESASSPAGCSSILAHSNQPRLAQRQSEPSNNGAQQSSTLRESWWSSEPAVGRVAHGVANRVDRLKAIGDGQVSAVAALAWRTLSQQLQCA